MRGMELVIDGRKVYASEFNEKTGDIVRLVDDVFNEEGLDSGVHQRRLDHELIEKLRKRFPHRWDTVCSPSPELVDISITDRCTFGCSFCYQDSKPKQKHGRKDLVETILKGFETVPYQIAIGGGEPTQHPDFPYILRTARELGTVPNYTTAGFRMTPEIVEATNEVCGGVAMTYHSFKGLDWFKTHYKQLRDQLKVTLNVHLIADRNVAKNLRDLTKAQNELGRLNVVLLAYYPDVGRATYDLMMSRSTYTKHLPEAIVDARPKGMGIAFSEGLLAYFLSRPEIGINTSFAVPSEGIFSCYFDPQGRISDSSFNTYHRPNDETVFSTTSQKLWEGLYSHFYNGGEVCYECRHKSRCKTPHETHYLICAYARHNRLPLDTKDDPVERRTLFHILNEDDIA